MSIFNWFFGRTLLPQRREFTVKVLGVECTFENVNDCIPYFERYLNQHSTLCAHCQRPIFPGEPVESAWIDAPHPYVHSTFECGEGIFWCGTWGESELIPFDVTHDFIEEKDDMIVIRPKQAA